MGPSSATPTLARRNRIGLEPHGRTLSPMPRAQGVPERLKVGSGLKLGEAHQRSVEKPSDFEPHWPTSSQFPRAQGIPEGLEAGRRSGSGGPAKLGERRNLQLRARPSAR
jgi:hypothetical protein